MHNLDINAGPPGVTRGVCLVAWCWAPCVGMGVLEVRAGRLHLPIAVSVAPHRKQQPRRKRDNGKIRTREAIKTCRGFLLEIKLS